MDQVFAVRQVYEKFLAKGKEVFWTFIDFEKAYDRIDRDGFCNILLLYDGRLLKGVKSLWE